MLPITDPTSSACLWFGDASCVIEEKEGVRAVFVGGSLVGRFSRRERCVRNAYLLGFVEDPRIHLGNLARAFGVTTEMIRVLRQVAREQGVEAAILRAPRGRQSGLSEARERKLEKLFDQGLGPTAILKMITFDVSLRSIERLRTAWLSRRAAELASAGMIATAPGDMTATAEGQPELPLSSEMKSKEVQAQCSPPSLASVVVSVVAETPAASSATEAPVGSTKEEYEAPGLLTTSTGRVGAEQTDSTPDEFVAQSTPIMIEFDDDKRKNASTEIRSAPMVQHLGTWLMIAVVARLGLFTRAEAIGTNRVASSALRIALEALIAALSIGEQCVEGVRRLQTRSVGVLLRAQWAPSATWTRLILGRFARELGGFYLQMSMAASYVREAKAKATRPCVYYVDNHMRHYTGKEVLRKGWRMQDKRAVPGSTDYWVHDEDGRPLFRVHVPENEALTEWLSPIARILRDLLGAGESMIVAFDRAGAFPEQMAMLRNEKFSVVTYERGPYPKVARSKFTKTVRLGEETLRYVESRTNLGSGRGRVRRICVLFTDAGGKSRQINLLAIGKHDAKVLIEVMRGRWSQENAFKHGSIRWGINQLDGRTTEPYSEEAIIPNPARRRLDRALRAARLSEGKARRELKKVSADSPKRKRIQRDLAESLATQRELEAQRPLTPTHAPLKDTDLSGILRRHPDEYKVAVDAIRTACANAESELAIHLGCHMKRPAEAKKLLANLLSAPGRVHVTAHRIDVKLDAAGAAHDQHAFSELLALVNTWNLTLPGDSKSRLLRFSAQK